MVTVSSRMDYWRVVAILTTSFSSVKILGGESREYPAVYFKMDVGKALRELGLEIADPRVLRDHAVWFVNSGQFPGRLHRAIKDTCEAMVRYNNLGWVERITKQ